MNKLVNKLTKWAKLPLIILLLVVIILSIVAVNVASDARSIGRGLGNQYGNIVGNMKGSYQGYKDGKDAGEEDARTPLEPSIDIEQRIRQQGKLHVLEVSMDVTDYMKQGEETIKVAILFTQKATADYSVDLTNASISSNKDSLLITVPDVEAELVQDRDSYKIIDSYYGEEEFSKDSYNMKAESEKAVHQKIENELNAVDSTIKQQARETARKQIKDLAETLSGKIVTVQFVTEGGEHR